MKKFRITIAVLVFSLLFATSAFAADKKEISNQAALYLIEKSNEAMEDVTSFKMEGIMEMLLYLEMYGEVESVEAAIEVEGLVDLSKGIYVNYDMDMGGQTESAEIFMSEKGISMRMPMYGDAWETIEDDSIAELMAMVFSGDTAYADDMLTDIGLDIAEIEAFEKNLYSSAQYTMNLKVGNKSYYVVEMSFDIKSLIDSMMGYMESAFIVQEADMYEGYAEEAMFMTEMMLNNIDGTMDMIMYIEKDTYYLGYTYMELSLDADLEMLLGAKMDLYLDYFLEYSEFNSKNLPFPTIN